MFEVQMRLSGRVRELEKCSKWHASLGNECGLFHDRARKDRKQVFLFLTKQEMVNVNSLIENIIQIQFIRFDSLI